jgi:predicted sugar kinase
MGAEDLSGAIHQRYCKGCFSVCENILVIIAANLEREPMVVEIDMDDFVRRIDQVDRCIGKKNSNVRHEVIAVAWDII